MTPITWQAAVDDEEQWPLLQDILEAADPKFVKCSFLSYSASLM